MEASKFCVWLRKCVIETTEILRKALHLDLFFFCCKKCSSLALVLFSLWQNVAEKKCLVSALPFLTYMHVLTRRINVKLNCIAHGAHINMYTVVYYVPFMQVINPSVKICDAWRRDESMKQLFSNLLLQQHHHPPQLTQNIFADSKKWSVNLHKNLYSVVFVIVRR